MIRAVSVRERGGGHRNRNTSTPPRTATALAQALAHVETEILPATGHMIMVERPNETIDAIDGFLQRLAA